MIDIIQGASALFILGLFAYIVFACAQVATGSRDKDELKEKMVHVPPLLFGLAMLVCAVTTLAAAL